MNSQESALSLSAMFYARTFSSLSRLFSFGNMHTSLHKLNTIPKGLTSLFFICFALIWRRHFMNVCILRKSAHTLKFEHITLVRLLFNYRQDVVIQNFWTFFFYFPGIYAYDLLDLVQWVSLCVERERRAKYDTCAISTFQVNEFSVEVLQLLARKE